VDLNGANLVVTPAKSSEPWLDSIKDAIGVGDQYKIVIWKQLVGILLVVYVKSELFPHITNTYWDTVGVGVMGVGGNKGAVAISLKIFSTTVCFVCAHLAAHQHNVQGRNSDYQNISQRLKFENRIGDIRDHDYLFWIGDLNYRIDIEDVWDDSCYDKIKNEEKDFRELLLEKDQLNVERSKGAVFEKYLESPIDFNPTYKYQPGTDEYERRPDKKLRMPAWCDRILWIPKNRSPKVQQVKYFRAELKTSDHKPVGGVFNIIVKVVVSEKFSELLSILMRQRDDHENENIAKVQLSASQVDFGVVKYDIPVTAWVDVENTGKPIAKFYFAPKIQEDTFCKSWLTVDPHEGFLWPGQKQKIRLVMHVTKETAGKLNTGKDTLEDILVFKLENGIHYFLSITGQYEKSCFGCAVEFLVRVPTPIRFYQKEHFVDNPAKILSIPKELWRIVDYIYRNGLGKSNLFGGGTFEEVEKIREALDTGEEFGNVTVESMAEIFIKFLESFPQPIYPKSLCNQWNDNVDPLPQWAKQVHSSIIDPPQLTFGLSL
jgi:phosphatidylinositol-bisphosphatase